MRPGLKVFIVIMSVVAVIVIAAIAFGQLLVWCWKKLTEPAPA